MKNLNSIYNQEPVYRKVAKRKTCSNKRPHEYVFFKKHEWTWFPRFNVTEFRCSGCGKRKYTKVTR